MSIEEHEIVRRRNCDESDDPLRATNRYPFYAFLFLICLLLLILMPEQVEAMSDEGWYLQPALGPLIGLGTILIFSFVQICGAITRLIKVSLNDWLEYLYEAMSESRVAIITSGLFYVYLHSIDKIGFFLSTFLLLTTLIFLTRLISRFWIITTFLVTILIMLIFRVAIGLWMDDVWLYGLLPDALADFCNMYL